MSHELTAELKELFNKLDKNKDGRIDFSELNDYVKSLSREESSNTDAHTQRLFDMIKNTNPVAEALNMTESPLAHHHHSFDMVEFVDYIVQMDKKIELVFKDLDTDNNGVIDKHEIQTAFVNLGIFLDEEQVDKLMQQLDADNSLHIDWKEWRDYFRFAPHDKVEEMLRHWRTESFLDFGEPSIPNDYTLQEKQSGLWLRNCVAGGMAGAVSRTFTAPLDRVRIHLQVLSMDSKLNFMDTMKNMVKEGGVKSLWRGNLVNVMKIAPESAIRFTAYEQIKRAMGQEGVQIPPFQKFIAGTLAGFISQSTIYPLDVLRTRLALRKTGQYKGLFDCVRTIYRNEGIRAFYRGYLINAHSIAGVGVDFYVKEQMKNEYKLLYPNEQHPSVPALLLIANTAATLAMFSTYPILLISTRLQSSIHPDQTITSIATHVYKNDGLFGFYRGLFPNIIKIAPSASIGFLAYEHFSKMLGVKRLN